MEERKLKVITEDEVKAVEEDAEKLKPILTELKDRDLTISPYEVTLLLDDTPIPYAHAFEYMVHVNPDTKAKTYSGKLTLIAVNGNLNSLSGKKGHLKASHIPKGEDKEAQVFFNAIIEFNGYKHYMAVHEPTSLEEFSFSSIF